MDTAAVLEWVGSLCGIGGALLMARNTRQSPFAYPLWIVSSIALVLFSLATEHRGLLLQQITFTGINLLGLYRWVLNPPKPAGNP